MSFDDFDFRFTADADTGSEEWPLPYAYRVRAARVVDGDTVDLLVDLGFRNYLEDRFRLADDFDAYEKRRPTLPEGKLASQALREILEQALAVRVETEVDKRQRAKVGKYGRYIARLFVFDPARREREDYTRDWINVAEILRAQGHAKPREDTDASQ
jgi:micrococcal nuclease